MPNTEDRATAQTNHTTSEAGQPTNRRNRINRAAAHKEQEPNGEETTPPRAGNGRARYTPTKFCLPRQNQGSSSLTGKFEEPYNFFTEAKTLAEVITWEQHRRSWQLETSVLVDSLSRVDVCRRWSATLLKPSLGTWCFDSLQHWIIILLFPGVLLGHQKHRFVCRVFLNWWC